MLTILKNTNVRIRVLKSGFLVNELSEKNKFTDCEKLPVSCRWICEDWKHKFTPTVKIAILEQAELMAEQGDKDDSIKVLIGHVEETLKGWR